MKKAGFFGKLWAAKEGGESVETVLVNIGQAIPTVIVILVFIGILVGYHLLAEKTAYAAGPQDSFYQLVTKLEALDKGGLPDGVGHAFYLGENYNLFGFNSDTDKVVYDGGKVEKPRRVGVADSSPEKCGSTEACVCICNKKECSESVGCNAKLQKDRVTKVIFTQIKYFVVKADADPGNRLNKGAKLDTNDVPGGGNYLALFGDSWRQGRVIYLKRQGNKAEITFPDVS